MCLGEVLGAGADMAPGAGILSSLVDSARLELTYEKAKMSSKLYSVQRERWYVLNILPLFLCLFSSPNFFPLVKFFVVNHPLPVVKTLVVD
jgi:hypothetical protein